MKNGDICARHYLSGESIVLRWREGKITSLTPVADPPPRDLWIAPCLVDLQINGYAGIDFQQDSLTIDQLLQAQDGLLAAGCSRWFLTLISDEWPRMMSRLRHLRALRQQSPELQAAIAGWHIEGPFLSAEAGFAGAHNPGVMCDPAPSHLHELREISGADPVLLTLAPERLEAISMIALARSLGFTVSLGHTNASIKRLTQAVKAGAACFTHLANGCPRLLDRHDNILWRVFEMKGLKVSLIPDAVHVSPALFRLIHRHLAPESIFYTSDAMAAAGAPPGRYTLGSLTVEVGEDQIVRLPGSPLFAGSALEPMAGVFRAAEMLESSWRPVWHRFSVRPAQLVHLSSGLEVGAPATFCLLRVTPENWLEEMQLYLQGDLLDRTRDQSSPE
jgi:N-acetylglucosamine-6-phosphate deacetylase